jgi:hypothetical protein
VDAKRLGGAELRTSFAAPSPRHDPYAEDLAALDADWGSRW